MRRNTLLSDKKALRRMSVILILITLTAVTVLFIIKGSIFRNEVIARPSYIPKNQVSIYLYGEYHGNKSHIEKEIEIFKNHYENGVRDLFTETEYYTAKMLNIWMKENGDAILDVIFRNNRGTQANTKEQKEFYLKIKKDFPETVFHGTDIGHITETGKWYLGYLKRERKFRRV